MCDSIKELEVDDVQGVESSGPGFGGSTPWSGDLGSGAGTQTNKSETSGEDETVEGNNRPNLRQRWCELRKILDSVSSNDKPKTGVSAAEQISAIQRISRSIHDANAIRATECKRVYRNDVHKKNSDATNGHSKLFRQLRANQAPPCSLIKIGDRLTGNMSNIHEEFASKWECVYNRLRNEPPCYNNFKECYAKYITGTQAGDLLPDAQQLQKVARRSKGTAPGADGWLPSELATLPLSAWRKREEHLRTVADTGKWPSAYHAVVSPCLRKMDKLNPDAARQVPTVLDHRLLSS
jgi:hypothetical protein